jgi:centrin-3
MFGSAASAKKPAYASTSRHGASSSSARAPPPGPSQLSQDQQQEIREAFELFDLDKDLKLDYHEFKVALRALGFDLKKQEVLKLMRDRNHDEGLSGATSIGLEGFMAVGTSLSARDDSSSAPNGRLILTFFPSTPSSTLLLLFSANFLASNPTHDTAEQLVLARDPLDEIRRAFKLFDEENTGKISFRNLKKVARELGENLTDEELCVLPPCHFLRGTRVG